MKKNIICTRGNGSFENGTLYLIQPLSEGRGGAAKEVDKRIWFSVTRGTGKVGGRTFYFLSVCL